MRSPHIYGNLNNAFGIGLFLVLSSALLMLTLFLLWRIIFDLKAATVDDSKCTFYYRYLRPRTICLPFGGRLKRSVRIPDVRVTHGIRKATLVYRGLCERALIPLEMDGANDLISLLTKP